MDLYQIRSRCTHEIATYAAKITHPRLRLSCPLKSGLIFLPARNKKLSPRRPYRTGLYASHDANNEYIEPVYGRGWHIDFRYMFGPISEVDRLNFFRALIPNFKYGEFDDYFVGCGPEVLIFARDSKTAKQISHALNASMLLVNGEMIHPIDEISIAADQYYAGLYECEDDLGVIPVNVSTANMYHGVKVMKAIFSNALWHRALLRLCHSARIAYFHPLDYSPSYPKYWPAIRAERDPMQFTALALAVTAAFSALEELGLDVNLKGRPLAIGGQINPSARDQLSRRIRSQGLDPDRQVVWLRRGGASLLERSVPRIDDADKTAWSKRFIRDHLIPLVDAIAFSKWIRNKAGAHKSNALTSTLRPHDLTNIQSVVRDILLELARCPHSPRMSRDVLTEAIREG